MGDSHRLPLREKIKGPGEFGRVRGLDDDRQPIGTVTAAGQRAVVGGHGQVLEKRKRKDEVEDLQGCEGVGVQMERFDDGRESVEWSQRGHRSGGEQQAMTRADHLQVDGTRKTCEPTTLFRIRSYNDAGAANGQGPGITRRRGRRIWKYPLPRLQVFFGMEPDIGEKVLSGAWDP